jgi:hypothetical protein
MSCRLPLAGHYWPNVVIHGCPLPERVLAIKGS